MYIKKLLKHKNYCSSNPKEKNLENSAQKSVKNDIGDNRVGKSIEKHTHSKSM